MLTDFNGTAITYDEIGNPLTMGSKTLTWNCRTLQSITDGENTYSYKYNGDGQRISKTVNGTKTDYYYNGSTLAGQKQGDNTLAFMYDNDGNAFAFNYNGNEYFYVKNAQNDVTGIIDSSTRTVIAEYHYDAWGNVISITDAEGNIIDDMSHIAHINPLRYRSYYYDAETNLYYLNSRYYSPEMCRFINADGMVQTGQSMLDKNMFSYCENNPVNRMDENGNSWKSIKQWFSNKWSSIKSWARRTFGTQTIVSFGTSSPSYDNCGVGISSSRSYEKSNKPAKKITGYRKISSKKNMLSSNLALPSVSFGVKIKMFKYTVAADLGDSSFSASISGIDPNGAVQSGSICATYKNIRLSSSVSRNISPTETESYSTNVDISTFWILGVAIGYEYEEYVPIPNGRGVPVLS